MEERSLFRLDAIGMWTKLRPGVRAMLAQLAPLFQMWIFTNGNRSACITHGTLFGNILLPYRSLPSPSVTSKRFVCLHAAARRADSRDGTWQTRSRLIQLAKAVAVLLCQVSQ